MEQKVLGDPTSGRNHQHPAVEFALKTFAFGLFSKSCNRSADQQESQENIRADVSLQNNMLWELAEEPRELVASPGFTALSCGSSIVLGITPEGDVHHWDAGGRGTGALARGFSVEWSLSVLEDDSGQRLQVRDVAIGRTALQANTAGVRAVALMDGGDVYAAEACSSSGSASRSRDSSHLSMAWRAVPCLQSHLIVGVSCGSGFCVALTASGELLSWGVSRCGALGIGSVQVGVEEATTRGLPPAVQHSALPVLVQGGLAGRRVAAVACGDEHVIAATIDEADVPGSVLSWGSGADSRIGYTMDNGTAQMEPRLVSWITPVLMEALRARREENTLDPDEGLLLSSRRMSLRMPQRITQLACGGKHSVVVCQGAVLCFGDNEHGQLGSPSGGGTLVSTAIEGGLIKLPDFASAPILRPAAEEDHTSESIENDLNVPNLADFISLESAARRVCCGALHTAAVSSDGHLHVWGYPFVQQHPQTESQATAIRCVVPFGPHRPVVTLGCGPHFVVVSAEVELPIAASSTVPSTTWPGSYPMYHSGHFGAGLSGWEGNNHSWRPANLPPKTEGESSHHRLLVRALEKNMQRRIERERREDLRRQAREEQRERRLQEHTETWLKHLLPSYAPGSQPSRRMEKLWRQGLPPRVREVLWPIAIGNVLRITPELYEIHRKQVCDARVAASAASADVLVTLSESPKNQNRERGISCIPFDLPRTFPTLAFFCEGGPLHEDCARILEAYTFFRPDIGYVQGMSYLAAMLLLYLPPYPSFVGFCNLINSPSILGLYRLEPQAVQCRSQVFRRLCASQMPAVARCIEVAGLTPEMFLIEWFMTIYSKCLAIDVASVIWDLFLLDGEVILYCAALALLRISESAILSEGGSDLEGLSRILGEELRQRAHDPDEVLWHLHEVWYRTAPTLKEEIRSIENTEFASTHGLQRSSSSSDLRTGEALRIGNVQGIPPPRELLRNWRHALMTRWMAR